MMEYFLLFVAIVVLLIAFSIFVSLKRKPAVQEESINTGKRNENSAELVSCPVCNTKLQKSEKLVSRIFRPMNTPDQRMTVQGCPHCFPVPEPGLKRSCPVCGKSVGNDGELVARLFNRTTGKKHVMIMGCNSCCRHSHS